MARCYPICLFAILISSSVSTSKFERRYNEAEETGKRFETLTYLDKKGGVKTEVLAYPQRFLIPTRNLTKLYLYTLKNVQKPYEINVDRITDVDYSEHYEPTNPNVFLVHDWLGDRNSLVEVKDAILAKLPVNLFVVDWQKAIEEKDYSEVAAGVPYLGQYLAEFFNALMYLYGVPASEISLICHGMGAHVCGVAGSVTSEPLGLILALDPAGPSFSLEELNYRLDEGDASFVEVVHTNTALMGYETALGHADFYPNGGETQPGCEGELAGECSHEKSVRYLAESIRSGGFRAVRCPNFNDFTDGSCLGNHHTNLGGFPVDITATGDYYLETNTEEPFTKKISEK